MPISIFSFIIPICTMFIIAPLMQSGLYEINPTLFRKIKIKKLTFLFRGIGCRGYIYHDIQGYGIIIPMLVLQIAGYIIAMLSVVVVLLLYFAFDIEPKTIAIVAFSILGCYSVIVVATTSITMLISKKREKSAKKESK